MSVSRRLLVSFVSLFALLIASVSFAQTTASLTGTVTSEGSGLPGVSVTISSPALQGNRTALTGEAGGYAFSALPPGEYTVVFELAGMSKLTKTTRLQLSQSSRVDAAMRVAGLTEAITVTATAASVLESSQIGANFTASEIENLPIARTIQAAALLAPGVSGNSLSANQFVISGGPAYDNLVMVNGVVITENVRSQFVNLFIEDAIQETTVLSGAVSAEYGRFTGGVVNTITKSGGNQFSGSLRDSFTNPRWTDKSPFNETLAPRKTDQVLEGTLGGYVMRDRFWFFVAGRKAETSANTSTTGITTAGDPTRTKAAINYPSLTDETRYEVKLTGQLHPKHNIVGAYLDIDRTETSTFTPVYDLASTDLRDRPDSLTSFHYNGIITDELLVEGQFSKRYLAFVGSGSDFTDLQKGTLLLDRSNGNTRFNSPTFCGVCDTETRNNKEIALKANYFLSTRALGNHNVVAGLSDFSEQRYANNHQSGSDYRIFVRSAWFQGDEIYPSIDGGGTAAQQTFFRWTPIFAGANESDLKTRSAFINDRWDFNNHWSFNVGVRYDKNDAVDGAGLKSSDDSAFAPRLAATYDIKGNGRHRVQASFATYVSRIVEGAGAGNNAAGTPATIDFAYNGPVINGPNDKFGTARHQAIQQAFDWFFSKCQPSLPLSPGCVELLRVGGGRNVPGFAAYFDGTLASPAVDEISLGYGVQIGSTAFAKIDFIKRDWKDFYAQQVLPDNLSVTTPLGIPVDLVLYRNTDEIERTYRGIQFQGQWRPRRWTTGLNYTWSKLRGNDETDTAGSGPVPVGSPSLFYPEYQGYANRLPTGYLTGDQRHRARGWVGYDIGAGIFGRFNISALQSYDSGRAYQAILVTNSRTFPGAPPVATSGYISPPTTANYYVRPRGSLRFESATRTDLAVNWSRQFAGLNVFAQGDLLNVFAEDARSGSALGGGVSTTVTAGNTVFNPFTQAPIECAQAKSVAQCNTDHPFTAGDATKPGWHYKLASNFGQATAFTGYQEARMYRFTLGLRF